MRLLLLLALAVPCSGAWSYYRQLNVDHTKVGTADSANYPVLVSASDASLKLVASGGHVNNTTAQATGPAVTMPADLVFSSDPGGLTKLPWEVESYDGVNGTLIARVLLASVSHTADTPFYMVYGDATVTTPQNVGGLAPSAVWTPANYIDVVHLDGSLITTNSISGAVNGTNTAATATAGQIGGGAAFVATNSAQIDFGSPDLSAHSALSASVWIKTSSSPTAQVAWSQWSDAGPGDGFLIKTVAGCFVQTLLSTVGGFAFTGTTNICDGAWHHVVMTWSSASGTLTQYLDGAPAGTLAAPGSTVRNASSVSHLWLGRYTDGAFFTGSIDEATLASREFTASWIAAIYNNEKNPGNIGADNFLKFGSETAVNPGSPPVVSAFTLVPASSSELLGTWTTDVATDSAMECGTSSGTYTITSETVNPSASGWGVTSHSMTIAGLSPSTLYFCRAVSSDATGTANSGELSASTAAPVTPIPLTVSAVAGETRYNDQFPTNGRQMTGDSAYCTWAGDGDTYCSLQDGNVPNTAKALDTGVWKWPTSTDTTFTSIVPVNPLTNAGTSWAQTNTNGWTDGNSWRTMGVFSVWDSASGTSMLYDSLFRSGGTAATAVTFLKSPDHGAHWIAPQNNSPSAAGVANGDMPTPGNCMVCATGFQYRLVPFQACQDHRNCPSTVANEQSYQYFFTNNGPVGVARIRLENLTLLDGSKIQHYVGANSADDGNYSAAWQSSQSGETLIPFAATGEWPSAAYLPDFHEYLMVSWAAHNNDVNSAAILIYTAQYPWSVPTLVGTIPRDPAHTNYSPAFPTILLASYRKLSSSPLTATIKIMTSGYFFGQNNDPTINEYTTYTYDVFLTAAQPVQTRPRVQYAGGGGSHIARGLDLYYSFDGQNWDKSVVNQTGNHAYDAATPDWYEALYDRTGMINFGFPTSFNYTSPSGYTLTTPYNAALNDFTAIIVFGHVPVTLSETGASINPAVSNEMVLDKTDLQIFRNGSTANSWKVKVGGTTSRAFRARCDGAFCALIIQRAGAAVTVARSDRPLRPLVSFSDATALGSNVMYLGTPSTGGGSQAFSGSLGTLLIWNRALAASEITQEVETLRGDTRRGWRLP